MKSLVFVFATDLEHEGYDRVLGIVQDRGGLEAVALAGSYHHSRDLCPHNPVRKIHFMRGEVFFQPCERLYARTRIRPVVSPLVAERDPLKTLIVEAEQRGLGVYVWTNNVHNTNLGSEYQDCTVQNAFGDPIITCLCPANPDVRAYVRALSADLARYPIESLLIESVSYLPYDHGYHHERTLLPLTGVERFLMSLCFCPHCSAAARATGVEVERLRHFVRSELEKAFNGEPTALDDVPLELEAVGALADGAVGRFLAARQTVITTLVAEIVEAVTEVRDISVVFMDMSGGLRGMGSGMTVAEVTEAAPVRAWQDGVDLSAVANTCDGLFVLGYTSDSERLRADLAAYRCLLPTGRPLGVALRPMFPDCRCAADVARLVRAVSEFAPDWLGFYHYGMMRLTSLDWIKLALADGNCG